VVSAALFGQTARVNDERHLTWLRRLRDVSHALAAERDPKTILPRILDAAVALTEAERGFLVRLTPGREKARIKVAVARGFDETSLQTTAGKVSRSVVNRVLNESRGVVTSQEEDRDLKSVTSVVERRVRSIIAVPLRLRGEIVGVLYLDHRFDHQAFSADDLPCLNAFADQAALAWETAELYADRDARGEKLGNALRELEALRLSGPQSLPDPVTAPRFGDLFGGSSAMHTVFETIERASRFSASVLITGESGTGKELVAREIHRRGERPEAPFVAVSCAAIPEALLPSELFGHCKGAFTGASEDRRGLLVEAGEGVVFLDEVGDMSLGMQAKLLRVLEERRLRPVGATETVPLTCRIIVATQHDLPSMLREGRFREDLYYRLDVLRIAVPPLRERREDIGSLFAQFLHRELGTRPEVTPDLLTRVLSYDWPGNVRELENEAVRLASLGRQVLTEGDLSPELRQSTKTDGRTLAEVEREMVQAALRETGGNKSEAARRLGVARSSFYGLLEKHGLA
jgi:transcriptional regulator with GAF, ATPase, and Fis domain